MRSQGEGRQRGGRPGEPVASEQTRETEPGLGGVAFLQNGRSLRPTRDPAADEQPEVPEFTPGNRRPSARLDPAVLMFFRDRDCAPNDERAVAALFFHWSPQRWTRVGATKPST